MKAIKRRMKDKAFMKRTHRLGEIISRLLNKVQERGALWGKIVRGALALFVFIGTGRLDKVLIGIGVCTIGAVLIGIDGITDGNEIRFFLAGIGLIAMITIAEYRSFRELAILWDHLRGGWHEYQLTTFDISEEAILKIHEVLDQDYPGIERYGKYWTRGRDRSTTERVTRDEKGDWINQRGKRLMTVTFEWTQENARLVVEYRRTPAQIWAARIIDTIGVSDEAHEKITKKLDDQEWRIRPRYRWICGLGWRGWILGVLVVNAMLWGGDDVFIGPDAPFPMNENALLFIRTTVIAGTIAALGAIFIIALRCHYFPSGVLRIGEEEIEQKRRDKVQKGIVNWMRRTAICGLGLLFVWVTQQLITACQDASQGTKTGASVFISEYSSRTNLCKIALKQQNE